MHLRRTRHENTNSITTFEFGKLKRNLTYAGKRSIAAPPSKSTTITFYVYQAKKSHLEKRCDILIECSKRMTYTHVGNFNSRLWKYICVPISHKKNILWSFILKKNCDSVSLSNGNPSRF